MENDCTWSPPRGEFFRAQLYMVIENEKDRHEGYGSYECYRTILSANYPYYYPAGGLTGKAGIYGGVPQKLTPAKAFS
jgi:hypothetical protein